MDWAQLGAWVLLAIDTVLAGVAVVAFWLLKQLVAGFKEDQREQWVEISKLRDREIETKDNADRRSKEIWDGIGTIRTAVSELATLSAGQYVRREDFREELRSLRSDLMAANRQEIDMLKTLIRNTSA